MTDFELNCIVDKLNREFNNVYKDLKVVKEDVKYIKKDSGTTGLTYLVSIWNLILFIMLMLIMNKLQIHL